MIYLKLLFSFFKVGLFSFGGGYAMIPLIQKEIENHSWITSSEFVDIIAIAEMTPGPIAVNSATFVGYKTAGILGSISATTGVALPSLIIAIFISKFFFKYQKHPLNAYIFYGIRPVIAALIMTAAVFVAETSVFTHRLSIESLKLLTQAPLKLIDVPSVIILAAAFIALIKFKVHPILVILGSAILGVILFGIV
ncbi:MAG TPA: chromate transporter [Thermoanaerobacterales bacterium]|nr:chromate transporter [Thermoanaerobacterales bacterium]